MSGQSRWVLGLLLCLPGIVPVLTHGADKSSKGVTYRWVDEQGVVHYGDRVPPQYAQKERAILNGQGVEVGHQDAQKSPEQLAREAAAYTETLKLKQHDSFLLTTYTSVKDIEALRDLRLDQLQGQRVAAEQYIENLHTRLIALQARSRLFRPYSPRPDARRMPDDLAEDLVRGLNEIRTQNNALQTKNDEVEKLKQQFQSDIERYRQLHDTASRH